MRNLVESGFSSFQDMFRDHTRSVTPRMQVRQLAPLSIYHNHIHWRIKKRTVPKWRM